MTDAARWQGLLGELAERHQVPGAGLAVLAGGEVHEAATGVLNVETGVPTTTDSVFQIGSVTKPYTATVVMGLVDEGVLDLDQPIVDVLPGFTLADAAAAKLVTLRHLLSHTSGISGDHLDDTGRGDDCLERYVATCATLGLSHPTGATMSYCNTGYMVAGRIVERVTGQVWDDALRTRLLDPLGLTHTVTLPERVLRFRAAFGHVVRPDHPTKLAARWELPRSSGPAGSIVARPADVVAFARMHLSGGRAPDGTAVLSERSAAAMRAPQVELPDRWTLGSHWGLGWILFDWDGRAVFGHDGNTFGQSAYLRVVPDRDVAICLLTNGGHTQDLYQDLVRELLGELCDLAMPTRPSPPDVPVDVDAAAFTGRYERESVRMDVTLRDGELFCTYTATGPMAALIDEPTRELPLVPVGERLFVTRMPGDETWTPVVFYELADGSPYMHLGVRANPKVG